MATSVKTTSAKSLCMGCNKEFTKKTLDEHNGICGRCFNKNTTVSTLTTAASTLQISAPVLQVSPNSTNVAQYSLPAMELKINNLSVDSPSSLTLSTRLENWYRVTHNDNPKNNAAVDFIYVMLQPKMKEYEKLPNINLLNIEKMLSIVHKALAD